MGRCPLGSVTVYFSVRFSKLVSMIPLQSLAWGAKVD